jgi:hypothetical protein
MSKNYDLIDVNDVFTVEYGDYGFTAMGWKEDGTPAVIASGLTEDECRELTARIRNVLASYEEVFK